MASTSTDVEPSIIGRLHSQSVNSLAIAQAHAGLAAAPSRDSAIVSTQKDLQALEAGSSLDEKQSVEDEQAKIEWEYDPANPRNWPNRKKWIMVYIVSFYTIIPPLSSSMMAPGLPEIAAKYDIQNPTIVALTLSAFLLAFALGPLFLAPLSEMYGRRWVLNFANLVSLAFSLGCAYAPNTSALIVMRLMTGLSGSVPVAIGGSCVSDLFAERDRARAMSLYTIGPLFGPAIGPVAGGFLVQSVGVKWVFIVTACCSAVAAVVGIPLLKETYGPVIRYRMAVKEGDLDLAHQFHPIGKGSKWRYLWINISRPITLLCTSLICFLLSLYMAFQYGIYYLMFATFADFFHDTYGFGPGIGGLVYLGLGGGFIVATLFCAHWADQIYQHLANKNGGVGKPEMRIPALIAGAFVVPVGLFWYGWSAAAKLHYMMPIIGCAIYGFGMMTTYLPISLYLVDSFTYAASALAAASVFRSLFGFAFPLFAEQMFSALGIGPAISLLGGLSIVLGIPFGAFIYYYGERLRQRSNLNR